MDAGVFAYIITILRFEMKKFKIGYTQGVFDMFHVGHLNIIRRAKEQCDLLIVGVNSDSLVEEYKNKIPVISEKERMEIVDSIKWVDKTILVNTLDKVDIHRNIPFDAVFIGSDWKGNERWNETEKRLSKIGVSTVYLPYTENISSTDLRGKQDASVE